MSEGRSEDKSKGAGGDASPHYSISARQSILETPEARVTLMTLAPGEATPWHRH